MDWIAFGTWLAVAYGAAFAFTGAALALRRYRRAAPLSVAAALFFAFAGTVAAQKGGGTNEPPRLAARPVRAAAQPPRPSAPAKVAKINARGAWRDSFLLDFGDGFLFPFGTTNRLSSVEIFTQGYARPRRRSAEFVADTGLRMAIVPGVSSISAELTPSNSWRVVWTDAAERRDTNALVSASIEFMRNGDMSVTTNGVSRTIPRVLPFAHNGFGQDDEWVAANFTNATEIAAAGGYAQWVDAQVGSGLTNGLYKFTVTIADTPPETVQLVVGDFSVAVTNAGEYVFLLEKGIEYEYGTDPYLSCVAYAAVDDIPRLRTRVHLCQTAEGDEVGWTTDGGFENLEPSIDSAGRVAWWPDFYGSPDVSHIWPGDGPFVFEAVLSDYCGKVAPIYSWTASDTLAVASPGAQSTEVDVGTLPSWAEAFPNTKKHDKEGKVVDLTMRAKAAEVKALLGFPFYADTDNDAILLAVRSYGSGDVVFAVNDKRGYGDYFGPWKTVLDKGLPNAGEVRLRRTAGAVYDLVRHAPVPFSSADGVTRIPVSYETSDGKALLVTARPLAPLAVSAAGNRLSVSSPDKDVMVPFGVLSANGKLVVSGILRDGAWERPLPPEAFEVVNYATGARHPVRPRVSVDSAE